MYKISEDFLTVNNYSRPGSQLKQIKGIVVHWVANANTSAKANRDFFENRKSGKTGYGSTQYLIDLDGSVIYAIPQTELAYHVGADKYSSLALERLSSYPNNCTIGIECTHIDHNGLMTEKTYETLVELCADLAKKFSLDPLNALYRHFDITGKNCHKWFVDNPAEWERFKYQVKTKLDS